MDAEWIRWGLMLVGGVVMGFWKREQMLADKERDQMKRDIQDLKDTRLHKDDFASFKIELKEMFNDIRQDIRELRNHA